MLSAAAVAYQQYLEAARQRPDDQQLAEDLAKARRALEVAWLERMASA